jgi:hypothetical protein
VEDVVDVEVDAAAKTSSGAKTILKTTTGTMK